MRGKKRKFEFRFLPPPTLPKQVKHPVTTAIHFLLNHGYQEAFYREDIHWGKRFFAPKMT